MENVNWGILGCGDVCERKSGPPMYKTPHSALAAVMRRDAAKAADFARRHGVPRSYTDAVAASFRFRSGVPGTGMWCFVAPPSAAEDSVVVTGRKGSVRFSTFDFTPVELVTARGVERFEIAPPEHIQGPLIETIVRELRGEGVCPSTGVSAARTSRVMDEIMKE